ncbi:MAG: hypothetical protein K0Q73_8266 [Paenibacillus sp.]|jgi:hypothetical protein|nr:hypothetical protein [Paenibacillus sp.]
MVSANKGEDNGKKLGRLGDCEVNRINDLPSITLSLSNVYTILRLIFTEQGVYLYVMLDKLGDALRSK